MPLDVLGRMRATLTKSASMSYAERLNGLVRSLDSRHCGGDTRSGCGEAGRTVSFRGSKCRVRDAF